MTHAMAVVVEKKAFPTTFETFMPWSVYIQLNQYHVWVENLNQREDV